MRCPPGSCSASYCAVVSQAARAADCSRVCSANRREARSLVTSLSEPGVTVWAAGTVTYPLTMRSRLTLLTYPVGTAVRRAGVVTYPVVRSCRRAGAVTYEFMVLLVCCERPDSHLTRAAPAWMVRNAAPVVFNNTRLGPTWLVCAPGSPVSQRTRSIGAIIGPSIA